MYRPTRKVLLLTLLVVLLCALPLFAQAETSGTCGTNLTWVLDDEGTLTISGTGEMTNYYVNSMPPWVGNVNAAIISPGVTSIGSCAFRDCSSLSSITLPTSLTEIGDSAFQSCTSLTSINIPTGVTSINDATFRECSSLTSINIPDGVTNIGWTAFYNCNSLSNINIPAGVTEIGSYAFCGCSSLTSLHIPAGVTSLKHAVFGDCSSLSSISLPAGVTTIGDFAFAGCSSLPSISLPTSVTSIGENAFQNCSSLTGISIPAGVTSIGRDTFRLCSSLCSVNIPNSVTSIDIFAFCDCPALKSIYIPNSVVSIHNRAFETSKRSVTIYCNEYSYAETWAQQTDHKYILLDAEQVELFLPDTFTMPVGSTRPLDYTIMPNNPDMSITWSSSDPSVATVDDAGFVTALSSGTTTITVKVKNTSASCKLTVVEPATALFLPKPIYIVAKSSQPVPVSISPSHAVTQLSYKTEDSTYLTVSEDGIMTAGAVGTTQLTVMDSLTGLVTKATVRITYPVTDVAFAQDSLKLLSGQNAQLTAKVTMRTDDCVNQLVTFKSSNTSVAVVDQNGLVHAVGAGIATITATADSGVSATCTVTVVSKESCPPGDADLDGVTTTDDALAILHFVADGSGEDLGTMDVDGNGTVDIYDAFMILQQEAGW